MLLSDASSLDLNLQNKMRHESNDPEFKDSNNTFSDDSFSDDDSGRTTRPRVIYTKVI